MSCLKNKILPFFFLCALSVYSENKFTIQPFRPAPYTHLNIKQNSRPLRFGMIGDHTGGANRALWQQGLDLLNNLQPEFVVSVGDLIEGKRDNRINRKDPSYKITYHALWDEFESRNDCLQMPFFYVPGNHDYWNTEQAEVWQERYGPSYYSFVYKDALFVILNSAFIMKDNSDPKGRHFDNGEYEQQLYWLAKTLKDNNRVQWTFFVLHHPFWPDYADRVDKKCMWKETENIFMEDNRPYTVIAGHTHHYSYRERFGRDYITLSTSGAGSGHGTVADRNFNHVTLITMTEGEPVIRNILYDGQVLDKQAEPVDGNDLVQDDVPGKTEIPTLPPRTDPIPPVINSPDVLIPNSSFESAGFKEKTYPSGWFVSNPEYTRSNEDANSGEWSLRLKTDKRVEPVIHQIILKKNAAYTLTASIKIASNSTGRVFVDTWDDFDKTAEFICTEKDAGEWKHFGGTFTNTSIERMFIRCFAEHFSGTCYFDDISLKQISGPKPELYDAEYVSVDVPDAMKPGETCQVTVQMKNAGVATWVDEDVVLIPVSKRWKTGIHAVPLFNHVVQGKAYTFIFDITAPSEQMAYDLQWQMKLKDQPKGFGEPTSPVVISVASEKGWRTRQNNRNQPDSDNDGVPRQTPVVDL